MATLAEPFTVRPAFFSKSAKDNFWAFVLMLPVLVPLIVFWIYPVSRTVQISFTDWNYISPDFNNIGALNYTDLLTSDYFFKVLKNTFVFTVFTVSPSIILGLLFAHFMQKVENFKNVFLCGIFSSWITPAVVVSMVWVGIFDKDNGIVNTLLGYLSVSPIPWLGRGDTAMLVVILVTVWQYTGLTTLLISSAFAKLDPEVEKANDIDGGAGLRKFFAITLPAIAPTMVFLIILLSLNSLAAYDQIYIMTQGGPAGATSTIIYYFYTLSFEFFESGKAAALAIIFLFICLAISLGNYFLSRSFSKEDAQ